MKQLILALLLFLSLNTLFAQAESAINFGASLSGFNLQPIGENNDKQDIEARWGAAIHADIFYDISSLLQLRSGIGWKQQRINFVDYSLSFSCDYDGTAYDPFNSYTEVVDRINYLSIPLDARFKVLGELNHLYLRGGIEFLFLLGQNAESTIWECGANLRSSPATSSLYEARQMGVLLRAGAGYEWRFLKKQKLFTELMFDYGLTDVYGGDNAQASAAANVRVFAIGASLGIRI